MLQTQLQQIKLQTPSADILISSSNSPTHAQLYEIYQNTFSHYKTYFQQVQFQNLHQFNKFNFYKLNQTEFNEQIHIQVQYTSTNKEVVVLKARWGWFEAQINILNVNGQSKTHTCGGNLHIMHTNQHSFMIKCIRKIDNNNRKFAIKQWFLLKIASILKIFPAIKCYLGFDIIMHQNCTQFAMEVCKTVEKHHIDKDTLYKSIGLLHQYNIVHQDIKPNNIMFSPAYHKIVLIDYGLSKFIKQKVGQKKKTNFVGTFNFCGQQMSICFRQKRQMEVDLYYNDLFSIDESIKFMKKWYFINGQEDESNENNFMDKECNQFVNLCLIKYLLLNRKRLLPSKQTFIKIKDYGFNKQLLSFLKEIPPNPISRWYFSNLTCQEQTETMLYNQIKYVYICNNETISSLNFQTDTQKCEYFSSFYTDLDLILDLVQQTKNRITNVKSLVLDKQQILKMNYFKYVKIYLEYISYLDNFCRTTAEERIKAAEIYIEIYIPQKQIKQKQGREIVQATILHILHNSLYQQKDQIAKDSTPTIILFRLYDFLTVLDLGSLEEHLKWVEDIYNHPAITDIYKFLFIQRVQLSLLLQKKRITSKKGRIRTDLTTGLLALCKKLIKKNTSRFKIYKQKEHIFKISCIDERGEETEVKLDPDFRMEKDFLFNQNHRLKRKGIHIYSEQGCRQFQYIKQFYGYEKFIYQLLSLYNSYFIFLNNKYCMGVYRIFCKNIADLELLKQFSFQFQINEIIDSLKNESAHPFASLLDIIDSYLQLMRNQSVEQTIIVFKYFFNRYITLSKENIEIFRPLIIPRMQKFLESFMSCVLMCLNEYDQLKHDCLRPKTILDILSMLQFVIPYKLKQFEETLKEQLKNCEKIKCRRCSFYLKINLNMKGLLDCIRQNVIIRIKSIQQKQELYRFCLQLRLIIYTSFQSASRSDTCKLKFIDMQN